MSERIKEAVNKLVTDVMKAKIDLLEDALSLFYAAGVSPDRMDLCLPLWPSNNEFLRVDGKPIYHIEMKHAVDEDGNHCMKVKGKPLHGALEREGIVLP